MSTYKVSCIHKYDHVLHSDKIINIKTGKEFTTIHDAIKDISGGICMLLTYLDIEFEIEGKGTIRMDQLECNRESIKEIYSHLNYLSGYQCPLTTYITIRDFIDDICYYNDEKYLDLIMSLYRIRSE